MLRISYEALQAYLHTLDTEFQSVYPRILTLIGHAVLKKPTSHDSMLGSERIELLPSVWDVALHFIALVNIGNISSNVTCVIRGANRIFERGGVIKIASIVIVRTWTRAQGAEKLSLAEIALKTDLETAKKITMLA